MVDERRASGTHRTIIVNDSLRKIIFFLSAALCLSPFVSPQISLLSGFIIAQLVGQPFEQINHKTTNVLLQITVVGLGFGLQVDQALYVGIRVFLFAVMSIVSTIVLGILLGRLFRVDHKTAYLISSGTAICGGSAVAAISPVIGADKKQVSMALGIVFILNAVALFVFPFIGEALNLSQHQFGLWTALAIHDTSSVVGAAGRYGAEALQTATTVKLTRALFIIPMALGTAFVFRNQNYKIKTPWFIILFVVAMLINTYIPIIREWNLVLTGVVRSCLTLTLFLVGTSLSVATLRQIGWKPLFQGILLWVIISSTSLFVILKFSNF